MLKYKRKDRTINAICWDGTDYSAHMIIKSIPECIFMPSSNKLLFRDTPVKIGDYLYQDLEGNFQSCPASTFHKLYEKIEGDSVSFSVILEQIKLYKAVRRTTWPEKTFIFKRLPTAVDFSLIIRMNSIPENIKTILLNRCSRFNIDHLTFENEISYVDEFNIISSWTPKMEDLFADDWCII